MTIINTGENQIKWTVRKGLSSVNEDFTRSDVMLFAISQTNKIPLPITSKETGVIVATIPHVVPATQENPEYGHIGIQEDTYDVELVWIKNKRELNRTYLHNAFRVSDDPLIPTLTVVIVSTAQSYGYDGLSAYEIAMFRRLSEGKSAICENQWLEDLLAEKANTTDLNALRYRVDDIEEVLPEFEEDIANLKADVSNLNDSKADKDDVYTKQHVDDNFATKTSVYTKSEVNSYLASKADKTALENAESRILNAETNILSLLSEMSLAETAIDNIENTIPSLATKEFVNSSISTNTATFRGTYNQKTSGIDCAPDADPEHVAERIPNVVQTANNNDYVFVQVPVDQLPYDIIAKVNRYKYVVTQDSAYWEFEYELNNSGFTAAQWAALNSGITDTHVQKVNGLDAALAAKLDVLTFDSVPIANSSNPVTSNGLYIELNKKLSVDRDAVINGNLTVNGGINIQMNGEHALNIIYTTNNRILFRFDPAFNGYIMGDNGVKVAIETGDTHNPTPVYHRITRNGTTVNYPILDTYNLPANVKTINNTSVAGAGNIDINDAFKVVYGVTPIADVVNAYLEGKHIYAVNPDWDENFTIANAFVLYLVKIDDVNNTDHKFAFSQYYGDGSDISWFELTSDGYSEIYNSTIATTNDLAAALSDYTTTSDLTTLLNGKQNTVDSSHKLSADVIDDSSATNKFVTASDKTTWNTVTEKAPLPFVVSCGIDPSDVPFVNSTLDEIWAAYQNGKDIRVRFTKAGGVSFEDDATLLLDGSRNCVVHTVHNGTHYVVTIYDDNGVTRLSYSETYDNPEIVNLTDGEHSSGYYEDLMRTVGIVKLDTPQIFIYTAYNNNHIATTAMCFSTCTNTETPTTNAVIKQTLFLGTYKSIRTLSNITSDNKYQVVDNWSQILDVKQSDLDVKLSKSGGSMTGDLDLDGHALLVRKSGNNPRNGVKFENDSTGVLVGNGNMNTTIQSGNADLKHRKGSTDYTILDTSNVKTINGNSINGSGDITIDVSQFVTRSVNDLTNYYTKSDTYTQSEINTLLGNLNLFKYEIYTSTSEVTSPANNVLYLIGPSGTGNDQYEEYVYANNSFVKIGDTSIDLSGYITSQQLTTALLQLALSILGALDNKQDTISDLATIRSNASGAVQKSGDTMQGNLVLGISASSSNKLKFNDDRDFARFSSNAFIIGDPHIQLKLETGNVDLKHRYTENDSTSEYVILDTRNAASNLKTVNGQSVVGTGDIDTHDTFEVQYNSTEFLDIVAAYTAGKMLYANELGIKYQLCSVVINSQTQLPVMFTFSTLFVDNLDVYSFDVTEESNVTTYSQIAAAECYSKPNSGIPSTDFDSTVLTLLGKADTAYQLPTNGIPATDLESAVLTSLGKADTAVQPATLNSYLQKSGGQMSGDLNMNSNGLLVRAERNGIKFTGSGSNEGVYVGNGSMRLFLEADSTLDVKHKKGSNYYAMLDEGNTKTINSSSLYGSGDLLLYTVSDVKANLEAMFTALVSAGVIQNYTLTDPASGSKTFGFSFT